MTVVCLFVCVVGPGFNSTSPAFVRSRASQAAESDGRIAPQKKESGLYFWGKWLCRHNLCRCLQHSHLVPAVSFWNRMTTCCCLPTPPCLIGGVLPYFEVTGHPVPVSSPGFKCLDCFIWNCSYIVYPSKMKGPFRDNCLMYYYL